MNALRSAAEFRRSLNAIAVLLGICLFCHPSYGAVAAGSSEGAGDDLRDQVGEQLKNADIQAPDEEALRELEILKQMQAEDPSDGDDSINNLDADGESEFSGFGQEKVQADQEVRLSDYDLSDSTLSMESGAYCYTIDSGQKIYLSVPSGAVTDQPVEIGFSSGDMGIYDIEYEGTKDPNVLARTFKENGTYELSIYDIHAEALSSDSSGIGIQIPVNFEIRSRIQTERTPIYAPDGFAFRSVTINGEKENVPDQMLVPRQDGEYEIIFEAAADPSITYSYQMELDTAAPELRFSENIEGDRIKPPVSFQRMEKDSEVAVFRNSWEIKPENDTLTQSGNYQITVTDRAGNSRTYEFSIAENHTKKIFAGVGTVLLLLAALLVYMRYIRDHMGIL